MDSVSNQRDRVKVPGFSLASSTTYLEARNEPSRQYSGPIRDWHWSGWSVTDSDETESRRYLRLELEQVWPGSNLQETVASPWRRLSIVTATSCPPRSALTIQASEVGPCQSTGSEFHSLLQRQVRPLRHYALDRAIVPDQHCGRDANGEAGAQPSETS